MNIAKLKSKKLCTFDKIFNITSYSLKRLFLIFLILCSVIVLHTQNTIIYVFDIHEEIAKPALRKAQKALREAEKQNADFLVLHLNTFGGELAVADEIRTLLLNTPLKTVVYINPNAASAGALISIACDSIFMVEGSNIGAASVVNQTGEIMPDKYQSYMRSLMRSTAEKKGRNPAIAEAMVDPDVKILGITDSGKVLTFTAQEALNHHYCNGIYSHIDDVYSHLDTGHPTVIQQTSSWIDSIIYFLVNPLVSGLLIMFIIGGIYFEMQSPGIGFPLIIAIIGLVLYFAPLYLEGLAENWEIVLFLVGVILLGLEFFVIPGFGIAGILGITAMVVSLALSLVGNVGFNFTLTTPRLVLSSFLLVVISSTIGFFCSLWVARKLLFIVTPWGRLALDTVQKSSDGYTVSNQEIKSVVGQTGVATSFMRPSGKIMIKNELYDAVALNGVIEKNDEVRVVKYENTQIFVEKINN